jgi:hypothetical protein
LTSTVLALFWLSATPDIPTVRLNYDPKDTGCPDRERLAGVVTARLGRNPFAADAVDGVEVQVRRTGSTLTAEIVRFSGGIQSGRRELSSPTTDCGELFQALGLALAIAIDPRAGLIRPEVTPQATPAAPAPVPPPVVPPPVVPPVAAASTPLQPRVPTTFQVGVAPTGSLGTGPTPTFGLALFVGLRHGLFALDLGGRVELPTGLDLAPGRIATQAVVGDLDACLAVSVLRACALAELGVLRVTSDGLTPPAQQTVVLADLGLRLAVQLQLFDHLALRPFLDVGAALTRTAVIADGERVWVTPPLIGTIGISVLVTSSR